MSERAWPDQHPELLPVLPVVYVAWADLDLDDDEIRAIRELVGEHEVLDGSHLDTWLDPDDPPDPEELQRLRCLVQRTAERSAGSLGDLARALEPGEAEEVAVVVDEIEDALEVHGPDVVADLVAPRRPVELAPPEIASPAFDVDALGRLLDGPHADRRAWMRDLLSDEAFEHRYGRSTDAQREQVLAWLRRLADEGLGELAYPGVVGDAEDLGPFLAAFEILAQFDLSLWTKVGVQFGLYGGSLYFLGSERHHERLPEVARAERLGCFAMTETAHGSNVRELETTARYDADAGEFVIDTPRPLARKDWIGNAALDGQEAVVFAQLQAGGDWHGVHALLVPIRDAEGHPCPGVSLEDVGEKVGLHGVDNGRIVFDEVRVPREALLDRFATVREDGTYDSPIASPSRRFFTMLGTLVGGRVSVANAALSVSKVALAIAVRYGVRRRQFGPSEGDEVPIIRYPTWQRRILPRLAATCALDAALEDLTRRYVDQVGEDGDRRELEAEAAGMKAVASWHAVHTVQACREACGGAGYLAANRFGDLRADGDVLTTFEGDNTVLLQLLTRSLLSGFRQQFADDRVFQAARFLAERAGATIARLDPVTSRRTGSEHLRDPSFHRTVFERREDDLLASLARRMQKRIGQGMDPFEAFTEVQQHAVDLAVAHVERKIVHRFAAFEEQADDDLRPWLSRLRALYALSRLEDDLGWFLENGWFEGAKARAIREEVDALCAEIAPQAFHLVEAFRVPESGRDAPIARH